MPKIIQVMFNVSMSSVGAFLLWEIKLLSCHNPSLVDSSEMDVWVHVLKYVQRILTQYIEIPFETIY